MRFYPFLLFLSGHFSFFPVNYVNLNNNEASWLRLYKLHVFSIVSVRHSHVNCEKQGLISLQMQHPLEKYFQYGMSTVNHFDSDSKPCLAVPCRSDGTALYILISILQNLNNNVDLAKIIHGKNTFVC